MCPNSTRECLANPRASSARDSYIQSSSLRQTYPPNSNYMPDDGEDLDMAPHHHPPPPQYSSLQGINQAANLRHNLQYQTTGSGSIFIEDVTAATKLMRKLGTGCPGQGQGVDTSSMSTASMTTGLLAPGMCEGTAPQGQVLMFDDNNICIEGKHCVMSNMFEMF